MKLTLENLNKFRLTKNNTWRIRNTIYYIKVCNFCGEYYLGRKNQLYCCGECRVRSKIDIPLSEETKLKLSKANKGKIPYIKGIGHSEETKKALSIYWKGKRVGAEHPNWNPNLSEKDRKDRRLYNDYYNWRLSVYERDNYTCQCCGERGCVLNAHHKDSYASNKSTRTVVENGITLCESCHKNFHHEFGNINNTKKQFYYWLLENKSFGVSTNNIKGGK